MYFRVTSTKISVSISAGNTGREKRNQLAGKTIYYLLPVTIFSVVIVTKIVHVFLFLKHFSNDTGKDI